MAIQAMFSVQNALSTPSGLAGLLFASAAPLALAVTVAGGGCARDFSMKFN